MPTPAQPRRYLWTFLGLTGGVLLAMVALNVMADPFRVFGTPRRAGLNDRVADASGFDRMTQPYELLRVMPRTVFFGSSTTLFGFRGVDQWEAALPRPIYNYGLRFADAHEVHLSLDHALRECPVEVVVMTADFYGFNIHFPGNAQFTPARLTSATRSAWPGVLGSDLAAFTLGSDALALSWKTLSSSWRPAPPAATDPVQQSHSLHEAFRQCERFYLSHWLPAPACRYEFASATTGQDRLADFEASLRLCSQRNLRLIVICPPIHARFQEALDAAGVWPQYEAWKRELATRTRAHQARLAGSGTVELWDFSFFNDLTCEPLPGEELGPMRYFTDSAHFTPELGRLILSEVLGIESSGVQRLGVRLDETDMESHLAGLRADFKAWRDVNPAVVSDVRAGLGLEKETATPSFADTKFRR